MRKIKSWDQFLEANAYEDNQSLFEFLKGKNEQQLNKWFDNGLKYWNKIMANQIKFDLDKSSLRLNDKIKPHTFFVTPSNPKGFVVETVDDAIKALAMAATAYVVNGGNLKINFTGHTDDQGEDGYNQKLSQARAQAVAKRMVYWGVPQESMGDIKGKGEEAPLVQISDEMDDQKKEQARQVNRRVEVSVNM